MTTLIRPRLAVDVHQATLDNGLRVVVSPDPRLGFAVVRADDYGVDPVSSIVDRMRRRLEDAPVYVSVDIDVLDPAHAPGTGTPEAGGLSSRELLTTLRGLVGTRVVGADLVEVAPAYDHAEITGLAAAQLGYELLSLWAADAGGHSEPSGPAATGLGFGKEDA